MSARLILFWGLLFLGLLSWAGEAHGQCGSCTITFSGNGNPSPNRNIQANDIVCISGNRTNNLNLESANNVQVCIDTGVILSGLIQNIQENTRIINFGQYGILGTPRNLTLSGNSAIFINEGAYIGNFTSNNGARITNRGSITGNIQLNGGGSPNYINSGTQTGSLTINAGTVTNDGILVLNTLTLNNGGTFLNAGNTSISGNLDVNGNLNNQGNLSVSGNFTGNGGSSVANSGNLGVAGNFTTNTIINSGNGSVNIGGSLTVNGGATFISGNTSVDGNVSNNGNINLNGQLAINGNLNLNGGSTVIGGSNTQCNGLIVQGSNFSNGGNIGGGTNSLTVNKLPTSGNSLGSNAIQGTCTCTPRTIFSSGLEVMLIYNCPGTYTWSPPEGLTQYQVLVVGGGGSGGNTSTANENKAGGGGGSGAVRFQTFNIASPGIIGGQTYNITVGRGGNSNGNNNAQRNGALSRFSNGPTTITANGGGAGGRSNGEAGLNGTAGVNGSAGGGAGAQSQNTSANGGTGRTTGGNSSSSGNSSNQYGGGGGGSTTGANGGAPSNGGGSGGDGTLVTIGFINRYGGGGGGGAAGNNTVGNPGVGGGGVGGNGSLSAGDGLPNTGAGGGGAGGAGSTSRKGGDGGSGIVIIRYEQTRILPVEFLYFKADYNSFMRAGDLSWATAKEWENDRFEIERSVNDVKSWETVGQVVGAGYSDEPMEYKYQDINLPLAGGNIFYRLKQFDFSGEFSYSDTKAIRVEPIAGTTSWRVYPNPTTGDPINLEMLDRGDFQDEDITVRIVSITGQYDVIEGSSPSQLSAQLSDILRSKKAGIFTLEISWGMQREYHKVILRR